MTLTPPGGCDLRGPDVHPWRQGRSCAVSAVPGGDPTRVRITHDVRLPDPVKIARYKRAPGLGPRILFFSGGTAIRDLSRTLTDYTHNSIHLITPFDSGGSSAKLRKTFHMPAVGDVRNRLMALADQTFQGNPEVVDLFAHRLPKNEDPKVLSEMLDSLARGRHKLVKAIPDPMRKIIRNHLVRFTELAPADFDLAGASIGNLVLTAGFLDNRRHLDPVIYIFSKLATVRGVVRPIVNADLHLITHLADGQVLVGQHLLSGKEAPAIQSPVQRMYVSETLENPRPATVPLRAKTRDLIHDAELICYPMGSFYSSLCANFLPRGAGRAVADNPCPKVYVPSTGTDPEAFGLSVNDQVARLVEFLRADDPENLAVTDVLQFVLVDTKNGRYSGRLNKAALAEMGITAIDCPLVTPESSPFLDPELLAPVLMSFI